MKAKFYKRNLDAHVCVHYDPEEVPLECARDRADAMFEDLLNEVEQATDRVLERWGHRLIHTGENLTHVSMSTGTEVPCCSDHDLNHLNKCQQKKKS